MARLFLALDPSDIDNPAERRVAQALIEQLPDRVQVFHSFSWLRPNRQGALMEGECDFVLLDPERGLLFIEVKGGALVFDGENWTREVGGRRYPLNKDPFSQANRAMHDLVEHVKKKNLLCDVGKLPCTYGFAVIFPECQVGGELPPSIHPELILDAACMERLEDSIQRVFERFRRPTHRALTERELEAVILALRGKYSITPVLLRKIEDQEERLCRLTDDQKRILDILANQPKAAIRGVAGSGKTMLAQAKALWAASEGMRTLLVCYNRMLKESLQEEVPESFSGQLVIDTYHGLVDDLCRAAGKPLQEMGDPQDQTFWTETAPKALEWACKRLGAGHLFDAVVVDEGQDFHDLWWTSLEAVFRDPSNKGCYYVFYDPKQNLYVENPSLPDELGQPYELLENCRNTVRIAEHCAALAGYQNRCRYGAPTGDEPETVRVSTLAEALERASQRVQELCMPNQGGLRMSQVAVLAPWFTERSWPAHFETIPLTKSFDEWRRNEAVLIASWSRFKGLEADAVVVIEKPAKNDANLDTKRYVARSRAKHLLTIIEVEEA